MKLSCLAGALLAYALAPSLVADERPNFLVILCDDLGYGDLSSYGHPSIRTPHLDRLASEGIRLTDCYSASPLCSPARAGMLTGRTPSRAGIYSWIPGNHPMHLRRDEVTVAKLLREAGYQTVHSGKWHLNGKFNSDAQPQPGDHGFEHWFSTQNNAGPSHRNPRNFVRNGAKVGELQGFSCQLVAGEACGWIRRKRDPEKPFFAFVCFHEPHEPIDSPADLVAGHPEAKKKGEALYYANVENMDRAVGHLLKCLKEEGLDENTLVFFTSDNGPETLDRYKSAWRSHGSPGPLRGMKLHVYEGGIRVPGILRWKGRIEPGQVSSVPVSGVDVLPTLCQLAGVPLPVGRELDGTSIAALLAGREPRRAKPLYWHFYSALGLPKVAMRDGDHVILAHRSGQPREGGGSVGPGDMEIIKNARLVKFELYNLREDLAQRVDLAETEPERLKALSKRLVEFHREVQAEGPVWEVGKKR